MLQVACCSSIPATLLCLTFWYLRYGFSLRSDIVWIVACWNYHVLRKLSISAERVIDHILYICQLCLSELHFTGIITLLFNLERGEKKKPLHTGRSGQEPSSSLLQPLCARRRNALCHIPRESMKCCKTALHAKHPRSAPLNREEEKVRKEKNWCHIT